MVQTVRQEAHEVGVGPRIVSHLLPLLHLGIFVGIEHGNKAVFFFRQKFGIKNEKLSVLKTGIARDHLREQSETELGKYP